MTLVTIGWTPISRLTVLAVTAAVKPASEKVSTVLVPREETPESTASDPRRIAATALASSDGSVQAHSPLSPVPGLIEKLAVPTFRVTARPGWSGRPTAPLASRPPPPSHLLHLTSIWP